MSGPSVLQLFERMCMALGGRAAESVIFNHVTTGNCFCLFFSVLCADRGPFLRMFMKEVTPGREIERKIGHSIGLGSVLMN